MTNRRITGLVLIATGVFAVSGCGSSSRPPAGSPGAQIRAPVVTTAPVTSSGVGNGY